METENGPYSTTSTTHGRYYYKQITRNFKTAQYPPCTIYSNADGSNN